MNYLRMPSGDMVESSLIKRVSITTNSGVTLHDGYGRLLSYDKYEGDGVNVKVRDKIIEFVKAGKRGVQPDWAFLHDSKKVIAK